MVKAVRVMAAKRSTKEAQFRGLRGGTRRSALRLHRLMMFELAFDGYLAGRVPAAVVSIRAKKMLQSGLPRLR